MIQELVCGGRNARLWESAIRVRSALATAFSLASRWAWRRRALLAPESRCNGIRIRQAALSAESPSRHRDLLSWRREPHRYIRLQTRTRQTRRQAARQEIRHL